MVSIYLRHLLISTLISICGLNVFASGLTEYKPNVLYLNELLVELNTKALATSADDTIAILAKAQHQRSCVQFW